MSHRSVKILVMLAVVTVLSGICAAVLADQHVGDHVWGNKTLVEAANCDHPAIYRYTCSICGATKEEKEGASDPSKHNWGEWTVTTAATCTATGVKTRVCQNNVHHTETQTIPMTAHTPGEWITTTEATCTANGLQIRKCTVCGVVIETRNVAALGHNWGSWVTTKAATCTAAGEEARTCSRCGLQEKRAVEALGHSWGNMIIIKAATCTAAGEEYRNCTRCGLQEKHTIEPLGHKWGSWFVVTAATCTKGGLEKRTCSRCGLEETRTTDPLGHDWGPWVVVTKATRDKTGLRQRTCGRCGQVQSDIIPVVVMSGNTLCSFGPRLRDNEYAPYVTDLWYMYTPFDASEDGTQTYELVASNMYIVGTVTLKIKDGTITVDYKLDSRQIRMDLEFFTILDRIRDLTRYEPEELKNQIGMPFRTPIDMAENFGDDTNLVLYFCCRITYTYDADNMFNLAYDSPAHKALLTDMQALLD